MTLTGAVIALVIGVLCATAGTARLVYTTHVRYGPIKVGNRRWRALQAERDGLGALRREIAELDKRSADFSQRLSTILSGEKPGDDLYPYITYAGIAQWLPPDVVAGIEEALR